MWLARCSDSAPIALKLLERLIDERIRAIAATGDEDETPARQPGLRAVLLMLLLWSWPWALAALAGFLPLPAAVSRPQASAALELVSAQLETLRVVAARLLVATACGAVIGLEREMTARHSRCGIPSHWLSSGHALGTVQLQ